MGKIAAAVAFITGAAIGGSVTWYYTREKYTYLAEQEITSVKEAFSQREKKLKKEPAPTRIPVVAVKTQEKESITDYTRRVQNEEGFTEYSKTIEKKLTQTQDVGSQPYIISPEEFGELDGYTLISLAYFEEDDILADEHGVIVDDVDEIVGDGLKHFGEYEEDSVFVRNDAKRCDYEILRDLRLFEEFRKTFPPNTFG